MDKYNLVNANPNTRQSLIYDCSYDTRIRPRLDQSQVVEVNTSFVPQSLLEFDTSEQKFSVLGYFRIKWYDEVVTWTPADYSDTNTIKVPVTEIWTPSLIILKVSFDFP